jgi:stage II sporulation protein D
MRRLALLGAVIVLGSSLLGPSVAAGAAPARPAAGWSVDRVRIEPIDGNPLGIDGIGQFRGAIEVVRTARGGVAVINDVSLEDYVRGISEVPNSWPIEAQKAQAIAARTYVLNDMRRRTNTAHEAVGADICATQSCQVYTGLAKERQPGSATWLSAVEATKHQVVVHKGQPIIAKYSSSNGGRTVSGGQPYLRSVNDPDDAASPLHRWKVSVHLPQLTGLLQLPAEPFNVHRNGDEVVVSWPNEDGSTGQARFTATDFRARLNTLAPPEGLPSTVPSMRYSVHTDGPALFVEGGGWGHGIGMSQWGAYGKAMRGMQAPDILAAYYSGLKPQPVPADKLPATVRVALDMDRPGAAVTGGRFRVRDGKGHVLAHVATGRWSVAAGPGRSVRVTPPAGQGGPVEVHPLSLDPGAPAPGSPVVLKLRLTSPAVLKLKADPPGADPAELAPVTTTGGEIVQTLPAAPEPGEYSVTVTADAGVGRAVEVPVSFLVALPEQLAMGEGAALRAEPARGAPGGPGRTDSREVPSAAAIAAAMALFAVAGASLFLGFKPRP